ncbi:MAG: hypothetical protein RLZ94_873 [Actinomycetota bacterium]
MVDVRVMNMIYHIFLNGSWSPREVSTEELRALVLRGEVHPDDRISCPAIDALTIRVGDVPALRDLLAAAPARTSEAYLRLVGDAGPDPRVLRISARVQGHPPAELGARMWEGVGGAASGALPNGYFVSRPESMRDHPLANFEGVLELRFSGECKSLPARWELHGMERFMKSDGTIGYSCSWQADQDWSIADDAERFRIYEQVGNEGRARRGVPDMAAVMRHPLDGTVMHFAVKRVDCLDAFDLCAEHDDGETRRFGGQRSRYGDITCMIEVWGFDGGMQRTWYFFLRDLRRLGGDPLKAAEALVAADVMPGRRPAAAYSRDGLVTVNEET